MTKVLLILLLFSNLSYAGISDYDVLEFGAAADGQTDNTQAFQSAMNEASAKGGTVHVPAGQFRFDGVLSIPEGVTLKGIAEGPTLNSLKRGTLLMVYSGRDDEDSSPFITLQHNSTVKGFSIYYPEQTIADVRPYPWTIQIMGNRCNIIDLDIVNTYKGIDCGKIYHGQDYLRTYIQGTSWDRDRFYILINYCLCRNSAPNEIAFKHGKELAITHRMYCMAPASNSLNSR